MSDHSDGEQLEQDRTDLSEDRTLLASERNFGNWMRTGLASVGVGLGFNALFRAVEPVWAAKAIATAFIAAAIFIFWVGERRALQVRNKLNAHEVALASHRALRAIAITLSAASLALAFAMWALL